MSAMLKSAGFDKIDSEDLTLEDMPMFESRVSYGVATN